MFLFLCVGLGVVWIFALGASLGLLVNSQYLIINPQIVLYSCALLAHLINIICKITLQQQCILSIFYVFCRFY